MDEPIGPAADPLLPEGYDPPAVEVVLTGDDLVREVQFGLNANPSIC